MDDIAYVEDGAQPDVDDDEQRERRAREVPPDDHPARRAERLWKWVAVGLLAVGAVGMYLLYRRIKLLEKGLSETNTTLEDVKQIAAASRSKSLEQGISKNAMAILAMEEKIVNTQSFIVDMAKRLKWPWPFNNRIQGLEDEFGLPKK